VEFGIRPLETGWQPARPVAGLTQDSRLAAKTLVPIPTDSEPNWAGVSAVWFYAEGGNDMDFLQLEAKRHDLFAEHGEVVLVCVAKLLD